MSVKMRDREGDMQTDADVDHNNYRNKLVMLDNDLTMDNLACLKFLCLDDIPLAKLMKASQATELFQLLENFQLLAPGKWYFLAECLQLISRNDLSSKILDSAILKMAIDERGSQIREYRKMLFDLCEDLDEEEVSKGIYLYGKVPKSKRTAMTCGMDFVGHLEQVKEVTEGNLTFLKNFLCAIGRNDLLERIALYEKSFPVDVYLEKRGVTSKDLYVDDRKGETDVKKDRRVNESSQDFSAEKQRTQNETNQGVLEISSPLLIQISYQVCGEVEVVEKLASEIGYPQDQLQNLRLQHPKRPDLVVLSFLTDFINENKSSFEEKNNKLVTALHACGQLEVANCLRKWMTQDKKENVAAPTVVNTGMPEINRPTETAHENIAVSTKEARISDTADPLNTEVRNMEEMVQSLPEPIFHMERYRMDRKPRGICLIIDNENFRCHPMDPNSRQLRQRVGSEIDRENLRATFESLDFIVEGHVYRDLDSVDMVRTVNNIAINVDHTDYDCFVACILSHGTRDNVYGADCRPVPIRDLTGPLKSISCPTLLDKPKLFFIQACQGQLKQKGSDIERDSVPDADLFEDCSREVIPNEADFLLGMATIPGFVSYRSRSAGSWYITKLCEALQRNAYNVDLLNLLTMVNLQVGKSNADLDGGRYKQSPAPFYTLRKMLQFYR